MYNYKWAWWEISISLHPYLWSWLSLFCDNVLLLDDYLEAEGVQAHRAASPASGAEEITATEDEWICYGGKDYKHL